jgi:DNA-binding NtrC family response regulator
MSNNIHSIRPPLPNKLCINIFTADGEVRKLEEIERDVIRLSLLLNKGCITKAAAQLGIGRSTLYRKLPELEASVAYVPWIT